MYSSSKARTIARRLLKQNRGTRTIKARSWRVIAHDDYADRVNAGTLCRFAKSEGEWSPKDCAIQIALGLKCAPKPRRQSISDMATATLRRAIENRYPMQKIDPRILREFEKLGWITK